MGEWGGAARHMSENTTHLKVMLLQVAFDTGENLYKNETWVGTEDMGLLFLCAPQLPFALLA